MLLRVIDGGEFRDVHIGEGEMFLLPGALVVVAYCPTAMTKISPLLKSRQYSAQPRPVREHGRNCCGACPSRRCDRCVMTWYVRLLRGCTSISLLPDRLRWYCKSGAHEKPTIILEESFHVSDLGTQLKPLIRNWIENEDLRRCKECGTVAEAK